MIARLEGTLVEKREGAAVVDVNGVGYLVHLSSQSSAALPSLGRVTLRCHTHVREDALQLYGFASEDEERLFHLLVSVSGVGPKLAINVLSGMAAPELAIAILHGELARLTKIAGVGKKTAERLVLELKDKIKESGLGAQSSRPPPVSADQALISALLNLGYRPAAAERAAEQVRRALGPDAPFEAQIREALRLVTSGP